MISIVLDELILPRQKKVNYEFNEINCKTVMTPNLHFNIFTFAESLFDKYSKKFIKLSCLEFRNVVFFQNDDRDTIITTINRDGPLMISGYTN